jgi:hypothetical protein
MKIILKLIIFQVFWNYGQVGIETITPASSAILDFPTTNNKRGIILPIVESLPTIGTASASRGTILLDKNDGKIKALIYKETTPGSGVFQDKWETPSPVSDLIATSTMLRTLGVCLPDRSPPGNRWYRRLSRKLIDFPNF